MDLYPLGESILLHPINLIFIEFSTILYVVGFTPPSSVIRPAALPIFIACIWLCISKGLAQLHSTLWATTFGSSTFSYLLLYVDVALLSGWSFELGGPSLLSGSDRRTEAENAGKKTKRLVGTTWQRIQFGLPLFFSSRFVGTPYQVKNVPSSYWEDPHYVPSRAILLLRTARSMMLSYLLVDIFMSFSLESEEMADFFSSAAVPFFTRLKELSIEEVITRTIVTITCWTTCYCILRFSHDALLFVIGESGLSDVRTWPPPFGNLTEAYTVRQFWRLKIPY